MAKIFKCLACGYFFKLRNHECCTKCGSEEIEEDNDVKELNF